MSRCGRKRLELKEVSETPRSKCRYLDKEIVCDVEVNDKEIVLRNLKGKVIATIMLDDIVSIEQKGNEFIISMRNGDRVSIMITKELLRRIMYIATSLELRSSAKEVLLTLKECLLTLSKTISLLEEILARLRRGSIPDWSRISEINREIRRIILSKLRRETSGIRVDEVIDVLNELSRNIEAKHVNGIRMTIRKLAGMLSNECTASLSHILAAVNLAIAVDIVLYIHSYCFARRFGMRLEADTSKAGIIDSLSELLNNVFWLGGEEPERIKGAVIKALSNANPNEGVEVFVNELIKGICSYYSVTCLEETSLTPST